MLSDGANVVLGHTPAQCECGPARGNVTVEQHQIAKGSTGRMTCQRCRKHVVDFVVLDVWRCSGTGRTFEQIRLDINGTDSVVTIDHGVTRWGASLEPRRPEPKPVKARQRSKRRGKGKPG